MWLTFIGGVCVAAAFEMNAHLCCLRTFLRLWLFVLVVGGSYIPVLFFYPAPVSQYKLATHIG